MWFVLALLSSLTFGLAGFMMKICQARRGSTPHLLLGLYFSGSLGFLWWCLHTGTFHFSAETLVAGTVIGFGSAVGNALFMKALDAGPASLTSPFINGNILLTVFMSVLFYGERLSAAEGWGVALVILAIFLLPVDPHETLRIRDRRWYGLVLLAMVLFFLRNGGLKITGEWGLPSAAILLVSYLFGLVWFAAEARIRRKPADKEAVRKGWGWGLAAGLFSFAGMQIYAIALEKGPASIVAPIFGANSLIVAVLSILVYRERLSPVQAGSLLLLFTGLILIRSAT
jgi:drug/metabolite transporter (DMT)-like permease